MRRYLAAPPARFARSPSMALLVWIAISGTFPIHLFVPVLPEAARDLHVSPAIIQYAITAYLIGLSSGQLFLGPLSDRFGRRPVLVGGLLIYVLGSLGAAIAPSMAGLIVARIVQAIGGCAGLVLGRAIARDITAAEHATRKLAVLAAAMSLGPGLAPLLGTFLSVRFGWRGMFAILAAASAVLLAITVLTLPETHLSRRPMRAHAHLQNWIRLLHNGEFLRNCLGGAFATTSFYAFVANAPFIFHQRFGFSTHAVSILYFLVICSLTSGSLAASVIAGRAGSRPIVIGTSLLMCTAAALSLAIDYAGATSATEYIALIMLLTGCLGVCSPFALAASVNAGAQTIGAASGLYGCLQMAAGALIVVAVGAIKATPLVATSIVLLGACGFALLCFSFPRLRTRPA